MFANVFLNNSSKQREKVTQALMINLIMLASRLVQDWIFITAAVFCEYGRQ